MSTSHQPEDDEPRAGVAGLTPVSEEDRSADEAPPWERDGQSNDAESGSPAAARDPLTGRPANPSEAQRVERDHELDRRNGEQTPGEMAHDDHPAGTQAPGRMVSPRESGDVDDRALALIEDLVSQGVARERAEELVKIHGADPERLKAEAWVEENLDNPPDRER